MKCQTCNQEITVEWRKDKKYINSTPLKFCSRKCSNRRSHTNETRQKTSSTMKIKIQQGLIQPPPRPTKSRLKLTKLVCCSFCKIQFIGERKPTKNASWPTLCSDQCYINTKRKNARGTKQTVYNGMQFDSLWEVEYVKFLEDQNIPFIIPSPIYWFDDKQKSHKYFPDFYIPILDLYVDPKNPIVIIQQQTKLNIVSKQINLLYGDLQVVKDITLSKWRAWKELHPHVSN
jgi:hypothetical protein